MSNNAFCIICPNIHHKYTARESQWPLRSLQRWRVQLCDSSHAYFLLFPLPPEGCGPTTATAPAPAPAALLPSRCDTPDSKGENDSLGKESQRDYGESSEYDGHR